MVELRPSIQACLASDWAPSADTALRLLIAAVLVVVLRGSGGRRFFPGQPVFGWLLVAMLWWLGASGLERITPSGECRLGLALLSWPAVATVAPLWALFLRQYVNSDYRPLAWPWLAAALVPALLMGLLALTNVHHHLLYGSGTALDATPAGLRMRYARGPAFYLSAGYSYLCALLGAVMVARWAWRSADHRRRYLWTFLVVTCLPWALNLAYLGAGVTFFGADPTPLSFGVAVLAFAILIRSSDLFRIVPLARRLIVEELPDPVLVLDAENRVMDANPAARLLAGGAGATFALPLADWPVFGPALAARIGQTPQPADVLRLGDPPRAFDLRLSAIGQGGRQIGRLLQLRDITEHQQAQDLTLQALAERNAQIERFSSQQRELREQALRDPLTGLYNRRALLEIFAFEAERQRSGAHGQAPAPMALALLDIDHFKRVNDSHGHAVGDEVLRALARALTGRLRTSDTLFRIGGEEFLLLMPGADAAIAHRRLQTLRTHLAGHPVPTGAGLLPITWSAGVAEWPVCGPTLDSLLEAADEALYRAKAEGRDRVLLAPAASRHGALDEEMP